MKFEKVSLTCLIFAFVLSCSVAEGDTNVPVIDKDNAKPDDTSTTTLVISTEITKATNSTLPPPPAPITDNTTTPTPPITTTPSSTTSKTTQKPSTSTTSVPPPTTAPTPSDGNWIVKNDITNNICIIMKSNISIHVSYGNKTAKQENNVDVSVPKTVKVTGSCGVQNGSSQNLKLSWSEFSNTTDSISFTFNKEKDKKEYYLEKVDVYVFINVTNPKDNSTEIKPFSLSFDGKEFLGHENFSFTCSSPSPLKLNGSSEDSGHLNLSALKYEAFGSKNTSTFSTAEDCDSHQTADIVPILVAGALILLVILVLIAYVVQRRRSAARGYLSM